jgi:hypothetical protein
MPLPDANKKSPRVYTNLQNLDLDNVTFANVQATGNPINVEEANEDELRRLVLVNLARLVTAGEWTGLLEAGGGGSGYGILASQTETGAFDGYEIGSLAPWATTNNTANLNIGSYPQGYPFVSPKTGTLSEVEIEVTSTTASSTAVFALYAQDEDSHMPSTMLGYVTFDTESATGAVSQTSFSGGTPSLVEGTQYWICYARGTTAYAQLGGIDEEARAGLGPSSAPTNTNCQCTFVGNWATANPVDDVGTLNQYVSGAVPAVVLKF